MNESPLVSIVINCYNGEEYVEAAINSLLTQTYRNFEIVFLDNMSTDKTRDRVAEFSDERIKYFCVDDHVSLGVARNLALTKTSGEYIGFLDVDDLWHPEKLSEQIPFFEDPTIGLVFSSVDKVNSKGEVIYTEKTDLNNRFTKVCFSRLFSDYNVVMSSSIVSKKALQFVGNNFDDLLVYAEEYDLFLRICLFYDAIKVNKILTSYRVHRKQSTNSLFEKSILEEKYVLAKLSILSPTFVNDNRATLYRKRQRLAWEDFLNSVAHGDSKYARKSLLPYVFSSPKYLAFFILSFLGKEIIIYLWDIKRRLGKNLEFDHK